MVSIKEGAEGHREMKDFVRKTGIPLVRRKLEQYITELKVGKQFYVDGMLPP